MRATGRAWNMANAAVALVFDWVWLLEPVRHRAPPKDSVIEGYLKRLETKSFSDGVAVRSFIKTGIVRSQRTRDGDLYDRSLVALKTVALFGAGAVGSRLAVFLTAHGVTRWRFLDRDIVEEANLFGRTIYGEEHLGWAKVDALEDCLRRINPEVRVQSIQADAARLEDEVVEDFLAGVDFLLLAIDDPQALIQIADVAYNQVRIPHLFAAFGERAESGIVTLCLPGSTQCLCCSLGISSWEDLEQLNGEQGLPGDIGFISDRAAELALWMLCRIDQPYCRVVRRTELDWRMNLLEMNRSSDGLWSQHWVETQRVPDCGFCSRTGD